MMRYHVESSTILVKPYCYLAFAERILHILSGLVFGKPIKKVLSVKHVSFCNLWLLFSLVQEDGLVY